MAEERPPVLPLRLTVARGGLGLELCEAVPLGPFEVTALSMTLPGLSFPLDLSGGVAQFRHRRGELQQLELRTTPEALARIFQLHAREVMGELVRPVTVWTRKTGLSVGVVGSHGALAFDILWAPDQENARGVIANARGADLKAPALGFALRLVQAALGELATRSGRIFTMQRAAARLATSLLPRFGARVPQSHGVAFTGFDMDSSELRVELELSTGGQPLAVETVRALETGGLASDADDLLLSGQLDAARDAYLQALEQAPRHPDLARAVAEIDRCVGGRAEAALGLLVDSMAATQAGAVGAELLAETGDLVGAREATAAASAAEPYAPVAALGWAKLAEYEPAALDQLTALDRACARAPALVSIRWRRMAVRLERRDLEGALADAQQLEAATRGAAARHEVCRRAARTFMDCGQRASAGRLFERALRYLPDDPVATAGLARAFMESNQPLRAAALLERAVTLAEKNGLVDAAALLDLAKLLARQMKDLPAAVNRLRQVPAASPRILEARALEGRFRARLGDLSGASLAYAQMRETLELTLPGEPRAKRWLIEAAEFEEEYQRDVFAAERHLALALRLTPHDVDLARRYRQVAALVAERTRGRSEPA